MIYRQLRRQRQQGEAMENPTIAMEQDVYSSIPSTRGGYIAERISRLDRVLPGAEAFHWRLVHGRGGGGGGSCSRALPHLGLRCSARPWRTREGLGEIRDEEVAGCRSDRPESAPIRLMMVTVVRVSGLGRESCMC